MHPGHGRRFHPSRPQLSPFHIQETNEMAEGMNFEDSYSPENASAIYRYYLHPDDIATKRNISMYSIQDHHEGTPASKTSPCRFLFGAILLMSFGAAIAVAVVLAVIMSQPDYSARYLPPENATYLNTSFLAQKEKGLEKDICKLVDKIFNLKGLSHINRKLDKCDVSLLKEKGNLLVKFAIHIDDTFIEKEADDIKSLVLSNTFNLKTKIDLDFNTSDRVNITTQGTPSVGITENASKLSTEDHTESHIANNVSTIAVPSSEAYFDIDLSSLSLGDNFNDLLFNEDFDYFLPLDIPLDDTVLENHDVSPSPSVTVSTSSYRDNISQNVTAVSSEFPSHQSSYTLSTVPEEVHTSSNAKRDNSPVISLIEDTVESSIPHSKLTEINSKNIFPTYASSKNVRPYTSLEVYDDNTLISSYLPLKEGTSLTAGLHTIHFTSSMLEMNTEKANVGTSTYDTFSKAVHHSNWNSQVNDQPSSVNVPSLVIEGSNNYQPPILDILPTKTSHIIPISEVVADANSVHQMNVTPSKSRFQNFVSDESVAMKSNLTSVPHLGNTVDVGSSTSVLKSSERSARDSSPLPPGQKKVHMSSPYESRFADSLVFNSLSSMQSYHQDARSSKDNRDIFLSPSSENIQMWTNNGNSRIMLSSSQELSPLGSEILLTSYDISNFDQFKTISALPDNIHTNDLSEIHESQTKQSDHSVQGSLISREIGQPSAKKFHVASPEMVLQSQLKFGILKSVTTGANSISVSSSNSMDDMSSSLTFTQQRSVTDQQPSSVHIRPSKTLAESTGQFIIEQGLGDLDVYLQNALGITDEERSLSGTTFSTRQYHDTPSYSRESSFDNEESTYNSDVTSSYQNPDSSSYDFTTVVTTSSQQNVDLSSSELFISSSVNTYQVESSYPVNFVYQSAVKLSSQNTESSLYQATSRESNKANITFTFPETLMKFNHSAINVQQDRLQIRASVIIPNITEKSFDIFNTPRPLTKISVPTFTVSNVTNTVSNDRRGNISSERVMTRKPLIISNPVASNTSVISTGELNNSNVGEISTRLHNNHQELTFSSANLYQSQKNTTEKPNGFQGSSSINQHFLNSQSNPATAGPSLYPNVGQSEVNTLFPIKHFNVEGMEAAGLTTTPKSSLVDKSVNIETTNDDLKSRPTAGWLQNNGVTLVPQRAKERGGRIATKPVSKQIATIRGHAGQFLFNAANFGSNFFRMN